MEKSTSGLPEPQVQRRLWVETISVRVSTDRSFTIDQFPRPLCQWAGLPSWWRRTRPTETVRIPEQRPPPRRELPARSLAPAAAFPGQRQRFPGRRSCRRGRELPRGCAAPALPDRIDHVLTAGDALEMCIQVCFAWRVCRMHRGYNSSRAIYSVRRRGQRIAPFVNTHSLRRLHFEARAGSRKILLSPCFESAPQLRSFCIPVA